MKKQIWQTPVIEKIVLKFDKEMDAPCYGSYNTPAFDLQCGIDPNSASNCWNKHWPKP